jgi:hypothetical protein
MVDLGCIDPDSHGESSPGDRLISELAERQYGVVARPQLLRLGLGRGAIEYRLKVRRLHLLYGGVYAVGHRVISIQGRRMAAVLACGEGAVLSHRHAAALLELRPTSRALVDVTTPARSRRGHRGIAIHRVRHLHREDRAIRDGIPVTSVARTMLDYAEVARLWELRRLVETAEKRRVFDLRAVERLFERSRGRRGLKPLAQVIESYRDPPITANDFERDFLDLCDRAGLPRPQMNVIVEGFSVDAVWREQRLVVELDSRTHHMTTTAFEEDRVRDATLQLAGYRVIRISWRRLYEQPAAVVATLRALLGGGQPAVR